MQDTPIVAGAETMGIKLGDVDRDSHRVALMTPLMVGLVIRVAYPDLYRVALMIPLMVGLVIWVAEA
jgi:ribosomal protein S19